jgi:hypothetical protein
MKNQNISKYMSDKISKSKEDSKELIEDICIHSMYEDDTGKYRCITCNKVFTDQELKN